MDVAIVGAGIGGLAFARALELRSIRCTVYEQRNRYARSGLGLLLLPNGLAALDALGLGDEVRALSNPLDRAVIRTSAGVPLGQYRLQGHRGIARMDLMGPLQTAVPETVVRFEAPFEGLLGEAPLRARVGGVEVQPDLLVAADGSRSSVRSVVAPEWRLEPCPVSELVSVCVAPDLAALYDRTFLKSMATGERLAVGLVPGAFGKIVWFVQFDAREVGQVPTGSSAKREFVRQLVGHWADPIPELVERTDFTHTHLWVTPSPARPPAMVHGRVVLIGDAAHPFPTLTSQGANAALEDAVALARHLSEGPSIDEALAAFEAERRPRLEEIRVGGQALLDSFLSADSSSLLPLVDV